MYTHVFILCINVCKFFRELICNVTDHKSYGLVLTATNEVHKCIVYILFDIKFFLHKWIYYMLCVMLRFQILENFHIKDNYHVLVFYIDFYTIQYYAFRILENLHILEIFLILLRLQYTSLHMFLKSIIIIRI